jgi:hypothetical protein
LSGSTDEVGPRARSRPTDTRTASASTSRPLGQIASAVMLRVLRALRGGGERTSSGVRCGERGR